MNRRFELLSDQAPKRQQKKSKNRSLQGSIQLYQLDLNSLRKRSFSTHQNYVWRKLYRFEKESPQNPKLKAIASHK